MYPYLYIHDTVEIAKYLRLMIYLGYQAHMQNFVNVSTSMYVCLQISQ